MGLSVCCDVAAGSGRSASSSSKKRVDVVGNVILHDKLDLWKAGTGSVHYHQGTGGISDLQLQFEAFIAYCAP